MSTGRYIRTAKEVSAPRSLVSVIVTAKPIGEDSDPDTVETTFDRAYLAASLWRRDHWEKPVYQVFGQAWRLHDWIEQFASDKRHTYVFSPIATDALTLTRFWDRITEAGAKYVTLADHFLPDADEPRDPHTYYVVRDVMNGKPDIVTYRIGQRGITWLSGRQYFTASEKDLAKSVGFEFEPLPPSDLKILDTTRSKWDQVKLWHKLFMDLSSWWREVKGGPWGFTAGHLGMQYFRKRVVSRTVSTHTNEEAKLLEDRAIFAGRASTWFYGDVGSPAARRGGDYPAPPRSPRGWIPGPVYSLDVRSMYPWLLATRMYPTRWIGHRGRVPVKEARELCAGFGVIADVILNTNTAEYPRRTNDRVVYSTGEFSTTLCGPELQLAIDAGEVDQVNELALYNLGFPFKTMCEELLFHRMKARQQGKEAWELFLKLLSNAFTGKLAQRGARWEHRPAEAPEKDWGEYYGHSIKMDRTTRFKARFGCVSEFVVDPRFGRPMGFAYAYLTSYARLYMRELRQHAPQRTVISQDTDGLWCLEPAYNAIHDALGGLSDEPGGLKLDEVQPAGRWFGPKHYWLPRGWTLSGFHEPARVGRGLLFEDSFNINPIQGAPSKPPTRLVHKTRRSTLDMLPAEGRIRPNGWLEPARAKMV